MTKGVCLINSQPEYQLLSDFVRKEVPRLLRISWLSFSSLFLGDAGVKGVNRSKQPGGGTERRVLSWGGKGGWAPSLGLVSSPFGNRDCSRPSTPPRPHFLLILPPCLSAFPCSCLVCLGPVPAPTTSPLGAVDLARCRVLWGPPSASLSLRAGVTP